MRTRWHLGFRWRDPVFDEYGIVQKDIVEQTSDECLQDGKVRRIIHKAVVEVNQAGTTAAAETANILCVPVSAPHFVFMDRPFLFLIMSSSDLVCFAGICARPSIE